MIGTEQDDVVMDLAPAPVRRGAAILGLLGAGAVLVWSGLDGGASVAGDLVLTGTGAALIWAGAALWRMPTVGLEFTQEGVRDTSGRWLARWEDVARIEKGPFALKPPNGFALLLRHPAPQAWAPGLWWRVGRRVGVGGLTPMRRTKAIAERIALRLALGPQAWQDETPDR